MNTVVVAYGQDNLRFTRSEPARQAEEVARGLHQPKRGGKGKSTSMKNGRANPDSGTMFE